VLTAALWAIATVFGAGSAWWMLLQTRKDLKRISQREKEVQNKNDSRYLTVSLLLLQLVPAEDRMTVAQILKRGDE
jgi:plasmid maintenance system antidote protein VapI